MKKFLILITFFLTVPFVTLAALRVPMTAPSLQPMPGNTAVNSSGNVNTPGNEINTDQQQIQQQIDTNPNSETPTPQPSGAINVEQQLSSDSSQSFFYILLIVLAGLGLLGALGWLWYRYRS